MASTIILKHGSGSNSPSSLTQGELAINIATGKLFYGTNQRMEPAYQTYLTFYNRHF
jgi:hypothetical protein